MLHKADPAGPLKTLAARDAEFVGGSSSGGVFPVLAGKIIDEG
jgi:hypothetical protein